jgi:hypothetical protein
MHKGEIMKDYKNNPSSEFMQNRTKQRPVPSIAALRGTLHKIDTSDIRDEADRAL